jgi:hypothetical protein
MRDILILNWNCPDCVRLKRDISLEKAYNDNPSGKGGQTLVLYYTFSNIGLQMLLRQFDIIDINKSPILKKDNGELLSNLEEIITYLKETY